MQAEWSNGKKCGSWKYWDDGGTLMYEEYYIADNLVGKKVSIIGAVTQLGILGCDTNNWNDKFILKNPLFCPDKTVLKLWEKYLLGIRKDGLSLIHI